MKTFYYNIIDKQEKTKEKGSGGLNDLMRPLGDNILYLLKELEESHENINISIKTNRTEINIYTN